MSLKIWLSSTMPCSICSISPSRSWIICSRNSTSESGIASCCRDSCLDTQAGGVSYRVPSPPPDAQAAPLLRQLKQLTLPIGIVPIPVKT